MSAGTGKTGLFKNPWSSFKQAGFLDLLKWKFWSSGGPTLPPPPEKRVQTVLIDWEKFQRPKLGLQTIWMGHSSFLVQLDQVHIITDPIFSDRCSPSQYIGPKRYTQPPCKVTDIPQLDVVMISHNHFDHMDLNTISDIGNKARYYLVPLNNSSYLLSAGIKEEQIIEFDWWESKVLEFGADKRQLEFTCTPCQHWSNRSITLSRDTSLWSSWIVQSLSTNKKFYFAGDTGYCTVPPQFESVNIHDEKCKQENPAIAGIPKCPGMH
jgi:N-acyl-phosphatidylethanolamine-hydrolysing phospholipase D